MCPTDTMSCERTDIDRCCSPVMGLVVFVQQWYPKLGGPTDFTMHGLWPDNCDGTLGPGGGCDNTRNYPNLGEIIKNADVNLYTNMTTYWPSYKGNAASFWSHEWNKHGTCVSTLEPTCLGPQAPPHQDVLEYFSRIMELRQEFNAYEALKRAGITPGQKYDHAAFEAAFESAWGVPVTLKCRRGQIQEVWMWMKVRGRDQYTPTKFNSGKGSTCGRVIYYPPKARQQ
ncbi:RNase Sy [Syncephalis plumigaleata]|nr:RNase Sy [Syncephalis plumigaleata]